MFDMKIWSYNYYVCVDGFIRNDEVNNSYAGGTYTLNGNRYQENIKYHAKKSAVGETNTIK